MDVLSPKKHLPHPDILAFFRLLRLVDSPRDALVFSVSENDAGTLFKEFLTSVNSVDSIPENAFLRVIEQYLADVLLIVSFHRRFARKREFPSTDCPVKRPRNSPSPFPV